MQMGYLLGGGSDFSSGGPGKGMHSRLYRNVLTRNGWINNCIVYNNTFEETGLFGILMSTPFVARGADLVDILCKCGPLCPLPCVDAHEQRPRLVTTLVGLSALLHA